MAMYSQIFCQHSEKKREGVRASSTAAGGWHFSISDVLLSHSSSRPNSPVPPLLSQDPHIVSDMADVACREGVKGLRPFAWGWMPVKHTDPQTGELGLFPEGFAPHGWIPLCLIRQVFPCCGAVGNALILFLSPFLGVQEGWAHIVELMEVLILLSFLLSQTFFFFPLNLQKVTIIFQKICEDLYQAKNRLQVLEPQEWVWRTGYDHTALFHEESRQWNQMHLQGRLGRWAISSPRTASQASGCPGVGMRSSKPPCCPVLPGTLCAPTQAPFLCHPACSSLLHWQ